jgi:signal transduction histidine kinase/ActR/RegA family two-component response regulator
MTDTAWPFAPGEMATLIRTYDWHATPLGPCADWPERLRGLVDTLLWNPMPSVLMWGEQGILIYNAGYAALSGDRHPGLLGSTLRAAWPEAAAFNGAMLARGLAGQPQVFNGAHFTLARDGATDDAWFDLYYGPVADADGRIAGVLAHVNEITRQVRAEGARADHQRELHQLKAGFEALAGVTKDVIYRMSPDWKEMRQLDGRGFMKDTATVHTSWIDEYLLPEDQAFIHAAIDAAIRDKAMFVLEHRVLRVDGSVGWTLSRAVPMLDAHGGIIGTASDITERKLAEVQLKETNRRKDEFLAMLAHELRNPLAPIGTAAELLQKGTLDTERIRRTSQIIGRQVTHMKELIEDLLDVSRVTRGLITLDEAALDIRQIVLEAVEQVTPLIGARRHALALDLLAEGTLVMGDKKRLVQVVANILTNAAKYTREGGALQVRSFLRADTIVIEVADNGVGMTPDVVARAFELFAQAERTPDRTTGGLGLGLALVKSLVELHGGGVTCASAGPDLGSTFTVCLPRRVQDAPVPAQAAQREPAPGAQALRILIVDDNVDAASMLALLLDAAGHATSIEHDPQRALERARMDRPQVCLVDIGLPGMDGNTLARHLRAQPETAGALLVAVTGYGQDSDRQRTREAGFDHHLVKPLDVRALYAILEDVDGVDGVDGAGAG